MGFPQDERSLRGLNRLLDLLELEMKAKTDAERVEVERRWSEPWAQDMLAEWRRAQHVQGLSRDECTALLGKLEAVPGVEIVRVDEAAPDVWQILMRIPGYDFGDHFTLVNGTLFLQAVHAGQFPGIAQDALDEVVTEEEEKRWLAELNAVWNSDEMQRLRSNLQHYGAPVAPGEEDDEGEAELRNV
jgi:hypothetical protein